MIAQFYVTLYVEEHGKTNKFHWMMEEQWFGVSYAQFARILNFGRKDVDRLRIRVALKLDARKIKFMYPRNNSGNFGKTTDMFPFYAYLNRLFSKTMTPREGNDSKILTYNKKILADMAPNSIGFEFSVFYFIWEEIKSILENPLKGCGYAPYIMHMIERVTGCTFGHDKDHQPLRIKNDLKAPIQKSRTAAPSHGSSPLRAARGRGQ
jgi:hypothetical protein